MWFFFGFSSSTPLLHLFLWHQRLWEFIRGRERAYFGVAVRFCGFVEDRGGDRRLSLVIGRERGLVG